MTTLLVIEPHAETRQLIRAAAPADWRILEADSGLSGLDRVRLHLAQIDLIVLGIDLPDLEALVVCMRIRALSITVPILPLADAVHDTPMLAELACLPALTMPLGLAALRQALQSALIQPARPLILSAALAWAQQQSAMLEHQVRQTQPMPRVVVFASSPVRRAGMARMLERIVEVAEAPTLATLHRLLAAKRWSAIVADGADYGHVHPSAHAHGIPLIVIAANAHAAASIPQSDVAAVVLESNRLAAAHLAAALDAIANGEPFLVQRDETEPVMRLEPVVPASVTQQFAGTARLFSRRAHEILWLDYLGYSTDQIARRLLIDPQTVKSHWKIVQRKLQMPRHALRAWVRSLVNSQEAPAPMQPVDR